MRTPIRDQVIIYIKRLIIEQSLKPGDSLPTEVELAEQLGVSRSSVREATKTLSFLGIVQSAPRRGLTVGDVDMGQIMEYLGFHFALSDYPKQRLLKSRFIVESGVLPETMARMAEDPTIYERLIDIIEKAEKESDIDRVIALDTEFHQTLLRESGIDPLVAFGDLLATFFSRFREEFIFHRSHWKEGMKNHRKLVQALAEGKLQEARELLAEHMAYYGVELKG